MEKWGLLDENGNEIIPPKYDDIYNMDWDGLLFYVENNGKVGLINQQGKEIIPILYDEISQDSIDIFIIKSGDLYGVYFEEGTLIPANYGSLSWLDKVTFGKDYYKTERDGVRYVLDREGYEYDLEEVKFKEMFKEKNVFMWSLFDKTYLIKEESRRKVSLEKEN